MEIRKYVGKDVEMLITALTIMDNAIANQDFLIASRRSWAPPFFEDFKRRIHKAVEEKLGVDSAKELRKSTLDLKALQTNALKNLGTFKIQLSEDFKSTPERRDQILAELGLSAFLERARQKDQEALIDLLYKFKTNMSTDLKNEIVSKGISDTLIKDIADAATATRNADVAQEGNKSTRKEVTAEMLAEFNEIYSQLISICKISRNLFQGNAAKQDLFSYSKILANLNAGTQASEKSEPESEV